MSSRLYLLGLCLVVSDLHGHDEGGCPFQELEGHVRQEESLHSLPEGAIRLDGPVRELIGRVEGEWFDEKILAQMVEVFRRRPNGFAVGEFWGKTTRALCRHVVATGDPRLRSMLEKTLADLMSTQDADGCISAFQPGRQPYNTDVWDRKYVLLGLLHGYTVTHDRKVLDAAVRAADHLLTQVGAPPKVRVVDTHYITQAPRQEGGFQGMESTSVLEPVAWLYLLTGKREYLDFCTYLIEVEGGSKRGNIFEAALRGADVKDFGGDGTARGTVAHAYNIISIFEGMTQYHRATGDERAMKSILQVYRNIREKENTVIGASCGLGPNQGLASTEQFSYSAFHQTQPVQEGLEGCTHARWMGLNLRLLRLTGDPTYADAFEHTFYNALIGSIRPDGGQVDYHTWLNGARPAKMNYRQTFNGKVITCCVFNVLDSLALPASTAVLWGGGGPAITLYLPGTAEMETPATGKLRLITETDYPRSGTVVVRAEADGKHLFPIRLRIPGWSTRTRLSVNGETVATAPGTFAEIRRAWKSGDEIRIEMDMTMRLVQPPAGTPEGERGFRALKRGPIIFARDLRLGGDPEEGVEIATVADGVVAAESREPIEGTRMRFAVPKAGGGSFEVMDFASSGNTWDARSRRLTWIPMPGAAPPRWIWFSGDSEAVDRLPVGKRWFRRVLEAPAGRRIVTVRGWISADNQFTAHVDGIPFGEGRDWQTPSRCECVLPNPSKRSVVAIEVENTAYSGANAAGLIGVLEVVLDDGSSRRDSTGSDWKVSADAADGWRFPVFDDSAWPGARVLGPNGMAPWKRLVFGDEGGFKGGLGF